MPTTSLTNPLPCLPCKPCSFVLTRGVFTFPTLSNNNDKHAYAGQLNSFTHLRALLVLHDRGIS
jgi:hypothetical protein